MAIVARERSDALRFGVHGVTVEGAIDHLVDAAQGVVQDELRLARLEVSTTANRLVESTVLLVVGALVLAGAGVALAIAGYEAFPPQVTPVERLAIIAGVCIALGGLLTMLGLRRMHHDERE